jgi:hypothetical protein
MHSFGEYTQQTIQELSKPTTSLQGLNTDDKNKKPLKDRAKGRGQKEDVSLG